MGRIFRPMKPLLDASGNVILDEHGKPKRVPRTQNWFIRYYDASGKAHDESTGSTKIGVAKALLHEREAAKGRGEPVGAHIGRLSYNDAVKAVEDDYAMNGRRTVDDVKRRVRLHLTPYFGGRRMSNITTDVITAYVVARQTAGAEVATINRELAILKRAFRLAVRARKLVATPYIPMLRENNTRQGFFEREQFEAVRAKLPAHLQPLATFCYWTGWRRGEVTALETRQVDLKAGVVRLEPGTTKNDAGRQFHFGSLKELRDVLADQIASAERLSREHDRIVSTVFHQPDGTPIKSLRKAWAKACKDAGYPGRLLHDFRRTAVRNLERAGVARSVAMAMVGHKTESIYRRYAIVDEAMHREAGEKLNAFATGKSAEQQGKVRQFKTRAGVR